MFFQRYVFFSREGFYYFFVLAFILGGATLRDVNNLLLVMAGVMLGPLLLNWRIAVLQMRDLRVQRRIPDWIHAGRPFSVQIRCINPRQFLGSWAVLAEDTIESLDASPGAPLRDRRSKVRVLFPFTPRRGESLETYRVLLPRRGRYSWGPLRASTRFPLGLVRANVFWRRRKEVLVYPRLGVLAPQWLKRLEQRGAGERQAHYRQGGDGDYYGLRQWRPGDSKRWIHWRSSARKGELLVRQFEHPVQRNLLVVLDLPQGGPSRREQALQELAVCFTATIVDDFLHREEGWLTIALAGQQTFCAAGATSRQFVQTALQELAVIQPAQEDCLEETLEEALELTRQHRGQVLVISTRPSQVSQLLLRPRFQVDQIGGALQQRMLAETIWLNVAESEEIAPIFQWSEDEPLVVSEDQSSGDSPKSTMLHA